MHRSSRWAAPAVLLAIAALLLTLTFSRSADAGPHAEAASAMPFRQALPQLAADSSSGSTAGSPKTPTVAASSCGSGHDSLINLVDAGAAAISHTAEAETVAFLRTRTRPAVAADATRTAPIETTVYKVSVKLDSVRLLPNKALVVVVEDPQFGGTMRVTLPDSSCTTNALADDRGATFNARTQFREKCGDTTGAAERALSGTADITGVGFWGSQHEADAADNGVELGPLLGFEFTGGGCDPAHTTPTPVPTQPTLEAITVGVDVLPAPGAQPGQVVHGVVHTQPIVEGVQCFVQYVNPPVGGAGTGTVLNDPALGPKSTDADGIATWEWTIPADSAAGEGRFEGHCGGKMAVAKVVVAQ